MSQRTRVDTTELRASAGACDGIANAMKQPSTTAVEETATAGTSLKGWSIGQALETVSTSWKPALEGLRRRAQAGADNLRSSADGHDWNEKRTQQDFEKTEADIASQAAPGEPPPALRHSGPPGAGHTFETPSMGGADITDPGNSYGTNMPTYDENTDTRQSLRDFG